MDDKNPKTYAYKANFSAPNEDPANYGSKGESWSPEFVRYIIAIASHSIYKGMPDAIKDDGKVQWEAPSNRSSGKYQFTHQKRYEWWQNKALEIGIDPNSNKWISKTAKLIHPTGEKPCKRCGQILRIAYCYPKKNLIKRIHDEFGEDFEVNTLETIIEIVQRALDLFGNKSIVSIIRILKTTHINVPDFKNDSDALLLWLEDVYIPSEPSVLSPGAMSNAPDRFDGFHSFNLCCRGKADKGRSINNLKTYTTDRRVFEFWSEGDWVAADRLMGLIRTKFKKELCADGGDGSPTADHIGPLSLGFCHRPQFKLLSKSANSAKNNKMSYEDVKDLILIESNGTPVASWYGIPLWDLRKHSVVNEETALRLSKMLRDNQRNAMLLLCSLLDIKAFTFLTYLLELSFADYKINFNNLRIENFITKYDKLEKTDRNSKYSIEQKSRRIRIAFESLRSYREKENRHLQIIGNDSLTECIKSVNELLNVQNPYSKLDKQIEEIIFPETGSISEMKLRGLIMHIPINKVEKFEEAITLLKNHMTNVATIISNKWDDYRYVRNNFDIE